MHMNQYKSAQAIVRKIVRQTKEHIGGITVTQLGIQFRHERCGKWLKTWREWSYPVLRRGSEIAVTNKEKASVLVNTFVSVHDSNNLSEEGRRDREK